jgi:hypothetical protein
MSVFTRLGRSLALLTFSLGGLLLGTSPCAAGTITFTGSGTVADGSSNFPVSASATFTTGGSVPAGDMQIVLTNTGAATPHNGEVLTGIFWSVHGSTPTLSLGNITLTAGSSLWSPAGPGFIASSPPNINGSWAYGDANSGPGNFHTLHNNPIFNPYTYGLSSVGNSGAISAANITLGNGGPDYGVVGAGTFPAGGPQQTPDEQNSITLIVHGVGALDAATITAAAFGYGSAPDALIPGTNDNGGNTGQDVAPEPGSIMLIATGLFAAGMTRVVRRMRKNRRAD